MQPVLNVRDVPGLEAAIEQRGVDAAELMRRAGTVVAQQAMREVDQGAVVVLCGPGNNGGDGWVAADYLAGHGLEVNVVTAAEPSLIRSAAAHQAAQRACTVGIPVHVAPDYEELAALLVEADVVIDAVFGTGFKGVMSEPFDMWVEVVDDYFEGMVLSVDVPSGINAATGEAEGPFFQADTTLTMFALKPGLIAGLGKQASGQLVVASLVGDDEGSEELADTAGAYLLGEADYLDALPERDEFADKYGHGRVLVVAGSTRFPGAAIMAAKAAARSGAGYVTLAVPAPVVPIAQAHLLSIPVVGLPAAQDGTFEAAAAQELASLAAKADCVLAGPGMGTSFGAGEVVRALIASSTPLVLDADALNVAASICLGNADVHPNALRREAPLVLTPHARELARLLGKETGSICCLTDLMDAAQSLAWAVGSSNFAVVAKAATSCVSCIETTLVPKAGPAALGTAGTGDVLAGIVAGLLSQQVSDLGADEVASADLALMLAAALRIQARAADAAVKRVGSRGVIATDLIDLVGVAFDDVYAHAVLAANADPAAGDDELDDEPKLALAPEVTDSITAEAAVRKPVVPGEVHAYEGDLDEPELDDVDEDASEQEDSEDVEDIEDASEQAGEMGEPQSDEKPVACETVEEEEAPTADAPKASKLSAGIPSFLAAIGAAVAPKRSADPAQAGEDPSSSKPDVPAAPKAAQTGAVPAFLAKVERAKADEGSDKEARANDAALAAEAGAVEQEAPEAPAGVPAFLSQVASSSQPKPVPASACATTIMPALTLEDIVRATAQATAARESEQAVSDSSEHLSPDVRQRQESRTRLEEFHERATMRAGEDEVTPVQERPRAHRVRRKK